MCCIALWYCYNTHMTFNRITAKHLLLLLALASAAILGGALIGQYGFGLHPCHLCILQRWPHAAVITLGVLGALWVKEEGMQRKLLLLCCAILFIGACIAAYHAGVEAGIFKGPDGCSADAGSDMSLEELRAQISGAALVSCSQAMAYIFGLSMAAWNALISLALIITTYFITRKINP